MCGRRGGATFLEAERAYLKGKKLTCKRGYVPCDPKGKPDLTICVRRGHRDECPITSIRIPTELKYFTNDIRKGLETLVNKEAG